MVLVVVQATNDPYSSSHRLASSHNLWSIHSQVSGFCVNNYLLRLLFLIKSTIYLLTLVYVMVLLTLVTCAGLSTEVSRVSIITIEGEEFEEFNFEIMNE